MKKWIQAKNLLLRQLRNFLNPTALSVPIKRKTVQLHTLGKQYDLQQIYEVINREYFESKLNLRITWFGSHSNTSRRRVLFGCYHQHHKLIKINRFLDCKEIPEYFVQFIIYHEMLHETHPPIIGKKGRRSIHHPTFKHQEKFFKEYQNAKSFLEELRRRNFVKNTYKIF